MYGIIEDKMLPYFIFSYSCFKLQGLNYKLQAYSSEDYTQISYF